VRNSIYCIGRITLRLRLNRAHLKAELIEISFAELIELLPTELIELPPTELIELSPTEPNTKLIKRRRGRVRKLTIILSTNLS
jgi:hypothetical protein